ncbi:uncharacterized protein LOC130744176 [Lotus japonicus]|uniref:uncharacterized protein LOC130744176 n=1 Tax=Lotus japonicus TaxID=34305 RepID=UPI0025857CEA|nr:uncharacterized protein LOC130744176 [Lotus japonicus]
MLVNLQVTREFHEAIHPFRKSLSWEHVPVADIGNSNICGLDHGTMHPEVEALTHYFQSLDTGGQSMVRRKLQAIYCPESSSLCTPELRIKSNCTLKLKESKPPKGRAIGSLTRDPSGFEHVDMEIKAAKKASQPAKRKKCAKKSDTSHFMIHFPAFLHPYIQTVTDVEDDGNCGYRSIAALLGHSAGEHGWPWVRAKLIEELENNSFMYTEMWSRQTVDALHARLTLPLGEPATYDKWMQLPKMGYLVANRFQLVLVTLSGMGCNTYLPLRGAGPPYVYHVISIGHVTNHFIQVHLTPGHPMPRIALQWLRYVDATSEHWCDPYGLRLDMYLAEFQAWLGHFSGHQVEYVDITTD